MSIMVQVYLRRPRMRSKVASKFQTPSTWSSSRRKSRKPLSQHEETNSSARSLLSAQGDRDAKPSLALNAGKSVSDSCSQSRVMYHHSKYAQVVQSSSVAKWIAGRQVGELLILYGLGGVGTPANKEGFGHFVSGPVCIRIDYLGKCVQVKLTSRWQCWALW
jgi:hypothetical protein